MKIFAFSAVSFDLARFMHRFSSRSADSAGLTRRATKGPTGVLVQYAEEPKEAQHSQDE